MNRNILGLHILVWLAATLVHAGIFSRFMPFGVSLFRATGNMASMAVIFYLNIFLVNRFLERRRYAIYLGLVLVAVLFMVGVRVRFNLLFPEMPISEWLRGDQVNNWRVGALATNAGVLMISAIYQLILNRNAAARRTLELQASEQEAHLQFLKAQINPHFLFNTLNNIYSLATVRSDKTADMVLRLSNLLRYVIYDGQAEKLPLSKEVDQIREYIELFRMRSETPLDIRFEVAGDLSGVRLEPMVLIPIVENCFKHCDFEHNPEAFIHLSLQVEAQQIRFVAVNSKDDANRQKDSQGGVGLANIRQRLALKYPDRHQLEINGDKGRFEVVLLLDT